METQKEAQTKNKEFSWIELIKITRTTITNTINMDTEKTIIEVIIDAVKEFPTNILKVHIISK